VVALSILKFLTFSHTILKMLGAFTASTSLCFSHSIRIKTISNSTQSFTNVHSFSLFTPPSLHFSLYHTSKTQPHFFPQASSSSSSISGEIMHSLSFIFRFFFLFAFSSIPIFQFLCLSSFSSKNY
jgi:hypothetical protein